jgi:large subunit ribosomal protein L10
MALTKTEKEHELNQLGVAFGAAETAILVDYRGLNVPQVTELRRQVRAAHGRYRVVKNTIARRAVRDTRFEPLTPFLKGTTAVAYTAEDPVALAKTLAVFAKSTPALTIKGGVVQGKAIGAADVGSLATLPGRRDLYAQLIGVLHTPLVRLVGALAAVPRNLLSVLSQVERKQSEA